MKSKPDTISFKVRAGDASCEYKGGLDEGIKYAFFNVASSERRLAVMSALQSAL